MDIDRQPNLVASADIVRSTHPAHSILEIGLFEKSLSLFCHALSQVTFTANKSTSQTAQKKDYCEVMAVLLFLFCFEKKKKCIGGHL